jgi:TolB protein
MRKSFMTTKTCRFLPLLVACLLSSSGAAGAQELGLFEAAADVGQVHAPGSSTFDAKKGQYRLTGGGANMWETTDGFHFLSKKVSGDLTLTATVRFPEKKGNAHRKAGWVVRSNLDADAPYADAIVHADGLIALQYRLKKGGPTQEIQSVVKATASAPAAIRLERHGDLFSLSVAKDGKTFRPVGAVSVPLGNPVHAGLAVCSHEEKALATAVLSEVGLENAGLVEDKARVLQSRLEIISVPGGQRQVVYETRDHIEAPNWSRDGRSLLFNSAGKLYTIPVKGGSPTPLDSGTAAKLNNDHGYSPDGKRLAISHEPKGDSLIYVMPAKGGEPRQVTALGPSYWHGWSPDGKTLAYCASRNDEYDIYTIAADADNSKEEKRLTTAPGLDDGPDYSADGKSIFFNSVRTGQMHIFRMKTDGSEQTQVTSDDEWADWFPHPSPSGRWMVFLSYEKGVEGHPPNKDVALRLMSLPKGKPRVLTRLFGGQGTINVPSWSPDSRSVAFVSYRLIKP